MAKNQNVSKSTVSNIWRSHNLKPHRVKSFKLSRDARFLEKLTDAPRRRVNGCNAQRNGAHHRRNHRRMQLYGTIREKTAVHYWLTRSHLSSYGLVTFLTSEIFLQIRASNTEMLTSSRWVVVVR
jgi:hypothetical protein